MQTAISLQYLVNIRGFSNRPFLIDFSQTKNKRSTYYYAKGHKQPKIHAPISGFDINRSNTALLLLSCDLQFIDIIMHLNDHQTDYLPISYLPEMLTWEPISLHFNQCIFIVVSIGTPYYTWPGTKIRHTFIDRKFLCSYHPIHIPSLNHWKRLSPKWSTFSIKITYAHGNIRV